MSLSRRHEPEFDSLSNSLLQLWMQIQPVCLFNNNNIVNPKVGEDPQEYPLKNVSIKPVWHSILRKVRNEQQILCHTFFRHEIKSALMHLKIPQLVAFDLTTATAAATSSTATTTNRSWRKWEKIRELLTSFVLYQVLCLLLIPQGPCAST